MSNSEQRWRPRYSLKYVLIGTAIISGILALYVNRPPPKATAVLHMEATPMRLFDPPTFNQDEFDRFRENQRDVIKSDSVIIDALRGLQSHPLLANRSDPVAYMKNKLSVSWTGSSGVVNVSFADDTDDPAQLVTIVDAVVDSYVTRWRNKQREKFSMDIQTLEMHMRDLNVQLGESYRELGLIQEKEIDEASPVILRMKRSISLLEKMIDALRWRILILRLDQEAPSRVIRITKAQVME